MLPTKAIYNTCFADPWLAVARELNDKYALAPVYWIGYEDDDSKRLVPEAFPEIIYHPYYDACRGLFPEAIRSRSTSSHLDIDFLRKDASYELQALKMMDRMDPDRHSFSFSERQRHFRKLLKSWKAAIDWLRPELVISATVPHRVFDYALYLLCRFLRIPFLSFHMTSFTGRIVPLGDVYSMNETISGDYERIMERTRDFSTLKAGLDADILDYYRTVRKDHQWAEPDYMAIGRLNHRQSSNAIMLSRKFFIDVFRNSGKYFGKNGYLRNGYPTYFKRRNKSMEGSKMGLAQYALDRVRSNRYLRWLSRYYQARTAQPDLGAAYVFLPLHYQPEMTSSPSGDIFVDQFLCVDTLVKHLPQDWKIYIKEHPSQFQSHNEGHTSRIREFYDDLLKFPNVVLVPLSVASFDLITNAKAVATVAGTVGWEAMAQGKPVLVFGLSWYENYPGVLKVGDETTAGKMTDFINHFSFDENRLLAYLAALQKNSLRAYFYRGLKEKMNLSEKECVGNLAAAVIGCIAKP